MSNEKLVILFLLVLLIIPSLYAIETQITVATKMNHDVTIIINNINEDLLETYINNSGSSGKVVVNTNISEPKINLIIIIRKDGKIVEINGEKIHRFDNKPTGIPTSINLEEQTIIPQTNISNATNQTVDDTINETAENSSVSEGNIDVNAEVDEEIPITEESAEIQEEKTGVTGAAISKIGDAIFSKTTMYIIITLLVITGLILAFILGRKKLIEKGTYINFKLGKDKPIDSVNKQIHDKRLEQAERKLDEARKELDEIKNRKSKIEEARKRFEEDKKELERLERG